MVVRTPLSLSSLHTPKKHSKIWGDESRKDGTRHTVGEPVESNGRGERWRTLLAAHCIEMHEENPGFVKEGGVRRGS